MEGGEFFQAVCAVADRSTWKREDEEAALARDDDGEEAAVGRNGEVTEGEAVKDGGGDGLRDGNVLAGRVGAERREVDPDEVAGFFLDGALEENARFVGWPAEDAETDPKACQKIGRSEIADFQNFLVNEIGNFLAAGGNAEAALVAVEGGELFVVVAEEIETLEAGRAGHGAVLFNGNGGRCPGKSENGAEGAVFVRRLESAGIETGGFEGEEHARFYGFGEKVDRDVVGEEERVGSVGDDAVAFGDADFFSAVVEEKGLEGVFCLAGVVDHGGGEQLGEDDAAVGGESERVADVAEGLVAAGEFLAFEKAAALARGVLQPDVVVFEVVELGFETAVDGIDDAAVGSVGESGDLFVDGLQGLVEILSFGGWQRAAAHDRTYERTKTAEQAKSAERKGAGHFLGPGCGPVNSEQQGFSLGVNSMNSTRVSSGS